MTHVGHELSKLTIRRFLLRRDKDVSGVSGLGHVAEGVVFTDGTTILRWHGGDSTAVYESPEAVERIHGHGTSTVIEWLDDGLEAKRCRSTVALHHDDDPQIEIVLPAEEAFLEAYPPDPFTDLKAALADVLRPPLEQLLRWLQAHIGPVVSWTILAFIGLVAWLLWGLL